MVKGVGAYNPSDKSESSETILLTPGRFRKVLVGAPNTEKFCLNLVVTAHYSAITWIPKSLIEQFTRMNNFYFLILCVLSLFSFSPKNPWAIIGTLVAVLFFTMIKEGVEDITRHRQDKEVNQRKILKYSSQGFSQILCQDLTVGDIIKIEDLQMIPADLVMIASSHPKGLAYVDTMNLDGENTLKEKMIMNSTEFLQKEENLSKFQAELLVDQPNSSLVKWNCNIKVNESVIEPMTNKQLLLRGCFLKNTDWVIGVVIYSGHETKIVMNSKKASAKFSRIQKKMNHIVITIFIFLFCVCLIFALLGMNWQTSNSDSIEYISSLPSNDAGSVIIKIFTYWILYAALIPISFYVVVEIERLIIGSFIKNDINMYYRPSDRPASVRSSDIVEELGQVEFIFSDKTGTLTRNEMVLMKSSIGGTVYGSDSSGISGCAELISVLNTQTHPEFANVDRYLRLMVLCNSVYPSLINGEVVFQATSPDELALVEASKSFGYELVERKENTVNISIRKVQEQWSILAELPFTSERKRMSVIVRNEQGRVLLLSKGADSVMLPLLLAGSTQAIQQQLKEFAEVGFRTLVMAGREIPKAEFDLWNLEWKNVMLSNAQNKDQMIETACDLIEKEMCFYGTSAIEDKLQEGVPETIQLLMSAGIRIWMLTGDKEETAIEIAKSCNLVQQDMEIVTFFGVSSAEIRHSLMEMNERYHLSTSTFKQLDAAKNSFVTSIAIAVNGIGLSVISEDPELSSLFFKLGYIAATCVCCRLAPAQKYDIVKLCKKHGDWMTLAIGDGANDVSMIQEAHIGVGIAGKEGTQATLAAEFTLAQFTYLKFLLLVHGRYAYKRIALFVLYYFYKNFAMEIAEAWFAIFSGFSGQIYYLDWIPAFFNLFWTSWPCLAFFALEQDLSTEESLQFPNLYSAGQKGAYFNVKIFWSWILFAGYSGTWIFWLPMASLQNGTGSEGHEPALFWISTVSFIMLMHIVIFKLFLISKFWSNISL